MVGLNRIATDNIENADDQKEAEDACPPRKLGEWVVCCFLDLADDAPDEGDEPRKLKDNSVSSRAYHIDTRPVGSKKGGDGTKRTNPIDVVASANGSPKMLPLWKPRRL